MRIAKIARKVKENPESKPEKGIFLPDTQLYKIKILYNLGKQFCKKDRCLGKCGKSDPSFSFEEDGPDFLCF